MRKDKTGALISANVASKMLRGTFGSGALRRAESPSRSAIVNSTRIDGGGLSGFASWGKVMAQQQQGELDSGLFRESRNWPTGHFCGQK